MRRTMMRRIMRFWVTSTRRMERKKQRGRKRRGAEAEEEEEEDEDEESRKVGLRGAASIYMYAPLALDSGSG